MNSRALSTLAIAGFLLLGAICLAIRYHAIQEAEAARQDSHWRLTYDVKFEAGQNGAVVSMPIPFDTRYCRVVNQESIFADPSLRSRQQRFTNGNRYLQVSTRRAGSYDVKAKFELLLSPRPLPGRHQRFENLTADDRQRYLDDEDGLFPKQSASVQNVIQLIPDEDETNAERVLWIFNYCKDIPTSSDALDDVAVALDTKKGTPLARARAMVTLCRAIAIPARLVTGFEIREQSNIRPHVWVEVFQDQSWAPYDPEFGYIQTLPMDYVPVRRAFDQAIDSEGAQSITPAFSIVRLPPSQTVLNSELKHPTQIFDLTRLPVPMHNVMSLLLLLPFGALITAIMRNVVGIQTFGTFAPALLALSFIYAAWGTGLAILIVVITAGLVGRGFLEKLRLLMVPRLSIILTTVILCVIFGVSLLDYMEVTPTAQAVLLPLVILTIMIERFYVTSEEDGWMFAVQLAIGTLVVAALCYLVLGWEEIGRLVLVYPEVHFLTIAVFIIIGRYAGYRLTELWRFRDMVESPEAGR